MSYANRGAILTGSLLAAALLAGCGGGGGTKSSFVDRHPLPIDTMTVAVGELGRYGGRFVAGAASEPKTLNPVLANDNASTDITNLLFCALAEYDNGRQVDQGMLAKSWEVSPDGLTWTFHLRRGACFSDGHPMTAEDVAFSFAVACDTTIHSQLRDALVIGGRLVEVATPDSYTVVVRSPSVSAVLLAAVGSIKILPRHVLEGAWKQGAFATRYHLATAPDSLVTSGPWRLAARVPGERLVLERNPYWFGVDAAGHRLPYLDQLVFLVVPDQNTLALKFQAGEIDGLDNVKPEDYASFEKGARTGHFQLYDLGPSLNSTCLWFNLNRDGGKPVVEPYRYAWFADRRFRLAVSHAIDRDAIIRSVLFGAGVKNWSMQTPGTKRWYDPSVTGPDHDPAGARRLLAEMGLRDKNGDGVLEDAAGHPVEFRVMTNADNNVRVQMLDFIRDDLGKVGIRMIPEPAEFRTLVSHVREDHRYQAVLLGFSSAVPPDPGMAANVYRSDGATHWWAPSQRVPATPAEARLDSLFERNIGTLDDAVRRRTTAEMARIINDEGFVVWLPSPVMKLPVRDGFGNLQPSPIPHRLLWNIDRVFQKTPHHGV